MAEKMITLGKRDDLHAKRQVFSFITKENVVKPGVRRGDAAEMAIIELV